ncbi:hypothetical protein V8E36_003234 [Tilletia maclaganii]
MHNTYEEERKAFAFLGKALSRHLCHSSSHGGEADKRRKEAGRKLEQEFRAEINDPTHAQWICLLRCMFSSRELHKEDLLSCAPYCYHSKIRTALHKLLQNPRLPCHSQLLGKLPIRARKKQTVTTQLDPTEDVSSAMLSAEPSAMGVPVSATAVVPVTARSFYAATNACEGPFSSAQRARLTRRRKLTPVPERTQAEPAVRAGTTSQSDSMVQAGAVTAQTAATGSFTFTDRRASPADTVRFGPNDRDIDAARERSLARLPLHGYRPKQRNWDWHVWGPLVICTVRSCTVLNYFDFVFIEERTSSPDDKDKTWTLTWQCRCCNLLYYTPVGATGNLVTHLHHCAMRLTPKAGDLQPWNKERAPHKRKTAD